MNNTYTVTNLSIDTRFADQYNSGTADFTVRLPDTYRNIVRIRLASVEIPLVERIFSVTKKNITFTVGGTPLSIPPGNYTAVALAAAVQYALQSIPVTSAATCLYDPVANRYTINVFSPIAIVLQDPSVPTGTRFGGLGYYMGFRTPVLSGSPFYISTMPPQLAPTPYYLMQLSYPDLVQTTVHLTGSQSSVPALAKIVLRQGVYGIQFDDGANLVRKEIVTSGQARPVTQFRVALLNPYGAVIDLGDADWSMTFELTASVAGAAGAGGGNMVPSAVCQNVWASSTGSGPGSGPGSV